MPTNHSLLIDIALAHSAFWERYHSGQGSNGYRELCRARALLDRLEVAPVEVSDLSCRGEELFQALRDEHGPKGYTSCPCRDCFNISVDDDLCADCDYAECCNLGYEECNVDPDYE